MPEKIFLTYTNATALPYQGTVLGHHIVLNYIDSNGKHHTLLDDSFLKLSPGEQQAKVNEIAISLGAGSSETPKKPSRRLVGERL